MNLTHLALAGFVASAAWAAWPRQPQIIDSHQRTRQFVIHSTLDRVNDAVVVLGDSIVEGSTLPRTICGHPVVNAGIGGLSTTTMLQMKPELMLEKPAALVVVSLGSNDAAIGNGVETFRANYRSVLSALKPLASHQAVVAVPSPEAGLPESRKMDFAKVDAYNLALPDIAKETQAGFIDLPAMPDRHTFDGVHLNAAGYAVWEKALADGIASIICAPKA